MKKLDLLMMKSFFGPFLLTTAVSNFILLIQYLLKYFDDFVGKNLGFSVFAELIFYFSLNMLQVAMPLGVLLASLMTFGNLGESFELTAIKSSGVSLIRTLRPIFLFILLLSIGAYFFNNYAIPAANLKAYSLLYDIKHTKPALDIKEGAFYNGIPDFSIKAKDKLPDGRTLKDVIIYDHTAGRGNKTVIIADSSIMYMILDERYLKLELYNGHYYSEEPASEGEVDRFSRASYRKMDIVFNLSSFDLKRRKEELFQNNRQMKNIDELTADIITFKGRIKDQKASFIQNARRFFSHHMSDKDLIIQKSIIEEEEVEEKQETDQVEASFFPSFLFKRFLSDEIKKERSEVLNIKKKSSVAITPSTHARSVPYSTESISLPTGQIDTLTWAHLDTSLVKRLGNRKSVYEDALDKARNVKVHLDSAKDQIYQLRKEANAYTIEKYKKYAQALACIVMFLVGAPLGAIIKKGGLGMPTIIAIFFFIIYYVFTSIGEKQAKEGAMNPYIAVWMADAVLLPFGLFFLRQARIDARLFEIDVYVMWIQKLKKRFAREKNKS